jgi:GNAT superfamily N-acetyltransferase
MTTIVRTNSQNTEFKELVKLLNLDLAERDGHDHPLARFNDIDGIKYVVMAYENQKPLGCGAMSEYNKEDIELKRVYVPPVCRGKGVATRILTELEKWAKELSYYRAILVTRTNQPEAKAFYRKNGYVRIPNYGAAAKIKDCLCFAKKIKNKVCIGPI